MKKLFLNILILFISIIFTSCQKDDSLDPRAQLVPGQYARLNITSKVINLDNPLNSFFGGILTNPSGNIAMYKLYVRYPDSYGYYTKYKLIKTITSFPAELKITLADLSGVFNVPVSTFVYGTNCYFYAESFDSNGNRSDFYSLSTTVQSTPSMLNGYRFSTSVVNDLFFIVPKNYADFDNYVNP